MTEFGPRQLNLPRTQRERVLRFPVDWSMGTLFLRDAGGEWFDDVWETFGRAQGSVTIPPAKTVKLRVSPEGATDLSVLASLAPDSLRAVDLSGTGVGDPEMEHLQHLAMLESPAGP